MGMTDVIIRNEIQTRLERRIKGTVYCYMKENDPGVIIIQITNAERRFGYKAEVNLMDVYLVYKSIDRLLQEIEIDYMYAVRRAFFR